MGPPVNFKVTHWIARSLANRAGGRWALTVASGQDAGASERSAVMHALVPGRGCQTARTGNRRRPNGPFGAKRLRWRGSGGTVG